MGKRLYHVFYIGMDQGKAYEQKVLIRQLKHRLKLPGGEIQLCYALFPQYSGKSMWKKKLKPWKPEKLLAAMNRLIEQALKEYECWEVVLSPDWNFKEEELPSCLMAACLYQKRPFDTFYVSFGQEDGMYEMEQMTELLVPYLPRLKQVFFIGRNHWLAESMSDFLYEEYGMVMMYTDHIPKNGISITQTETWKFLDAVVKNGYNTLVNCSYSEPRRDSYAEGVLNGYKQQTKK